jgi:hypothetical protein
MQSAEVHSLRQHAWRLLRKSRIRTSDNSHVRKPYAWCELRTHPAHEFDSLKSFIHYFVLSEARGASCPVPVAGGGAPATAATAWLVLLAPRWHSLSQRQVFTRMADAEQAHVNPTSPSSNVITAAAAGATAAEGAIQWTAAKVAITCALFVFAGLAGVS